MYNLQMNQMRRELNFREATFLQNRLIPHSVHQSISDEMVIMTGGYGDRYDTPQPAVGRSFYTPSNKVHASREEVEQWFAGNTAAVLQMHYLYDAVVDDIDPATTDLMRSALENQFGVTFPKIMQ